MSVQESLAARGTVTALNVLSVLLCLWLLLQLLRLPSPARTRLFPRLMFHLALADCGRHLCKVLMGLLPEQFLPGNGLCDLPGVFRFVNVATDATLFFELLLNLSFLLQSLRCSRVLKSLSWSPMLAWLLALGISPLQAKHQPSLSFSCIGDGVGGSIFISINLTCLLVSSLALIVVVVRTRYCSDVVRRRHQLRAAAYIASALLTEGPQLVVVLASHFAGDVGVAPRLVGELCRALNGAGNACTFFLQSRYSGEAIRDVNCQSDASFHVSFKPDPLHVDRDEGLVV